MYKDEMPERVNLIKQIRDNNMYLPEPINACIVKPRDRYLLNVSNENSLIVFRQETKKAITLRV